MPRREWPKNVFDRVGADTSGEFDVEVQSYQEVPFSQVEKTIWLDSQDEIEGYQIVMPMTPAQAREVATLLIRAANQIEPPPARESTP
jgi:hypothetical protein